MICIDCRYVRERPSGIGLVVEELVARLPDLMPNERFLLLKHPKGPERLSLAPNTRDVVVPQEANGPATLWWLSKVVDLSAVRLFHAPFNILPAGLPMATVVTLHDLMWISHPQWAQGPGPWGYVERWFYRHGIRRALRRATRICAISQATAEDIALAHPPARARTRVLLQGPGRAFRPARDDADARRVDDVRQRYVQGASRYVLTVGQYAPYKNHEAVVRAFARAFGDDPSVHLVLVQRLGRGERVLGGLARSAGIEGRYHLLPTLSGDDLLALYHGAACLCHPSLVEGFGMPLAEAMASGCPVVTSDRSAMPEVCGDAAEYVDPQSVDAVADALSRVVGDQQLAAEMSARGLRRAAQLGWEDYARGHVSMYLEALEAHAAAP